MTERPRLPHQELVVATAHHLLMTPLGGQPHELYPPRDADALDLTKIVRATERREPQRPITIELESGQRRSLPLFEVTYTGLEFQPEMRRLMAGLALDQVVVASRLGGRYLHRTGLDVQDRFGHPARIIREPVSGALLSAERIGVPQPTSYRGGDVQAMDAARPLSSTLRLVNYLPEDMYLATDGELLHVANCGLTADVNYHYDTMAQTSQGVLIARSTPQEIVGMPTGPGTDELRLVHTEVLFESLRLGAVSPQEASHMVVAAGVRRMPSGQQGNTFTGLAYYSADTLNEIYHRIKI